MKRTLLLLVGCIAVVAMANADIVWDVTSSTYNGIAFVPVEGAPGMGQAGSGGTVAYVGGSMDGDVFHMGFSRVRREARITTKIFRASRWTQALE
jgi:hypothetical protein